MASTTTDSLVGSLRDLGLLDTERLRQLSALAQQNLSVRDLARQVLKRGWLTSFQLHHLLRGEEASLHVGPYQLLDILGEGGMGKVYKARHRRLQRIAALKVIGAAQARQGTALTRFQREAEAAGRLSHPNIVAVFDAGEDDGTHYLAMEFIDGIDLGRLLRQAGPLPVVLACDFLRQAALGLHHAHEAGFVHRDVKPQNLLLAPRGGKRVPWHEVERLAKGTVKILDMGLVRMQTHSPGDSALALTQLGVVLGTMDYLAPEQARNAHRVDRRADLYSLGCTLYHLLTGSVPFPAGTALDRLLRHQSEEPPRLTRTRPDVPRALEQLVAKLLAKEPEDRFQTAAEVAVALQPFSTGPVKRAMPSFPVPSLELEPTRLMESPEGDAVAPIITPTRRPRRGRGELVWWILAAVGALVLLRLFLGSVSAKPRRGENDRPAKRAILSTRTTSTQTS